MGAPQKYPTRRVQAEAVLEAVLADPDAILGELVRRGHLEQLTNGTYRKAS